MKRRVLFYRTWTNWDGGTSGGHLKMLHAYQHIQLSPSFEPFVYFPPETVWHDNPGNYWLTLRSSGLKDWSTRTSDVLFFSGKDWEVLEKYPNTAAYLPVLNIAQPRHTLPHDPRNRFLRKPAIRIAKSQTGKDILQDYGVNGPVFLIPDAIDPDTLPRENPNPKYDLLIVGLKNEPLARRLESFVRQQVNERENSLALCVQYPPKLPTREDFLALVNQASMVCFLPNAEDRGFEGFYLPALEAMAMKKLVICPDVVGNRDFCVHQFNCLKPEYSETAIQASLKTAFSMSEEQKRALIYRGHETSGQYHIQQEREAYLHLLDQVDDLWQNKKLFHD
jgi:glycosyltransferase involved in cell wall biosynthesis